MNDEGPAEEDRPVAKPRRKKRRRRVDPEASAPPRPPEAEAEEAAAEVDEQVPAFARTWPQDPELSALVAAFEAGEYARVRREAPALARRTESDAVRRAARELRRRLDPDPVAVYMLVAAAALLVFLAGWYWLHPHTP
jgi:hypothetical protein